MSLSNIEERERLNIIGVGMFPPHPGGAALSLFDILDGCAKRGHRIRVLSPIAESSIAIEPRRGEYSPRLELTRFPVPYFQTGGKIFASDNYRDVEAPRVRRLLRRMSQEERPNLFFVGRETFAPYVAEVAAETQIPYVLRIAGATTLGLLKGTVSKELADSLLEGYRHADIIVSPARHMADRVAQLGLHDVRVIPNAIDINRFKMGKRDRNLRRRLNIGGQDIVVGHVSNLQKLKRSMDVVLSADQALRRNPSLLYLFIGDGTERAAVEAKCAELGIADRVRFTGWVAYGDMPAHYRLADLVVMPAEDETLARVFLETQACGCVLISSDIAAAREVIIHDKTGSLFPVGDIDALTELTLAMAADPRRRARIGREARAQVTEHSLDDAVESYIELFRTVTRQRASSPGCQNNGLLKNG